MKGFAITLDAVMAITFFIFAMVIISSQSYQPRAPGGIYLKQLTLDATTVMEKTGRIEQALSGNMSAMQDVLEATPKLACIQVTIANSTGDIVAGSVKSDCTETQGLDIQTTTRPALYQGGMYVVRTESWFRKEPE